MELAVAIANSGVAVRVEEALSSCGCESFQILPVADSQSDNGYGYLRTSAANILAMPLESVPLTLPEDLVIAALTSREDPAYGLLLAPKHGPKARLHNLPRGAAVGVHSELAARQLAELKSDLQVPLFEDLDHEPNLNGWPFPALDGLLLPLEPLKQWHARCPQAAFIRIDPSECQSPPGAGAVALITLKADLSVRRWLKTCHHRAVAQCTNVERRLGQLALENGFSAVGAWCTSDNDNTWTLFAALLRPADRQSIYGRLSSVTTAGLAELLWERLQYS